LGDADGTNEEAQLKSATHQCVLLLPGPPFLLPALP